MSGRNARVIRRYCNACEVPSTRPIKRLWSALAHREKRAAYDRMMRVVRCAWVRSTRPRNARLYTVRGGM